MTAADDPTRKGSINGAHHVRVRLEPRECLEPLLEPMELEAALRGDDDSAARRAVRGINQLYRAELLRYLERRLVDQSGHVQLAQDCLQEVLLRVWLKRKQLYVGSDLRAWLFKIAERAAIDAVRKITGIRGKPGTDTENPDPAQKPRIFISLDQYPQSAASVDLATDSFEDQVVNVQVATEIAFQALAKLSPQERRCVLLQQSGFSPPEIAEMLSIADGTVGSYASLGRVKFIKEYRRLAAESGCELTISDVASALKRIGEQTALAMSRIHDQQHGVLLEQEGGSE